MDSDDEDDLEDAERTLEIIMMLRPLVDQIFPNGDDSQYRREFDGCGRLGMRLSPAFVESMLLPGFLGGATTIPKTRLYQEYELTMLQETYLEEMSRLEPEWMEVFKSSVQKRDLDVAVRNCDNEFLARHIRAWAEDMAMGHDHESGLMERILNKTQRLTRVPVQHRALLDYR
ncbi:hypothetical protein AK830_g11854 [Neonectria ditissima]|uniref:Uncharacterized protein n=1 Tax=Neonectria ditissima TaxID=78410 RepID=A0A0P7B1M9_9HYPO|nr:hypothetical protein AK830_g11854 [Neonectria ditissima]